MRTWSLGGPVLCVAWCPDPRLRLVSGVVGSSVVLLASGTGTEEAAEAAREALQVGVGAGVGGWASGLWAASRCSGGEQEGAGGRGGNGCKRVISGHATWVSSRGRGGTGY